jgi:hypothetical protein
MSIAEIQKGVLAMPHAFVVLQRLQDALEKEKELRKHFYEIIEENLKMEFINGEIIFHSPVKLKHNDATGNIYKFVFGNNQKQRILRKTKCNFLPLI